MRKCEKGYQKAWATGNLELSPSFPHGFLCNRKRRRYIQKKKKKYIYTYIYIYPALYIVVDNKYV